MTSYPPSVWEYSACLARHLDYESDASYGCPACGWCPELPECHAACAMSRPCPYIQHKYRMDVDDGEVSWRKRDFLWVVPRLVAWKARAVARVEAEYAIGGARGRRCIDDFQKEFCPGSCL